MKKGRWIASIMVVVSFLTANAFDFPFSQVGLTFSSTPGIEAIYSFPEEGLSYPSPGRKTSFWIAAGNASSNDFDTTFSGNIQLNLLSAVGNFTGTTSGTLAPYFKIDDWTFDAEGTYQFEVLIDGLPKDTFVVGVFPEYDVCTKITQLSGCTNSGGTELLMHPLSGNIVPVDAVFPISVGVVNIVTGKIDSSFIGTVKLTKTSGPGLMTGSNEITGSKWVTFYDIKFTETGIYEIIATSDGYKNDTLTVEVTPPTNIMQIDYENTLKLYPNPVQNTLHIETKKSGNNILRIHDAMGKLILTRNISSSEHLIEISVGELENGIYFIETSNLEAKEISRGIFMKK